MAPPRKYQRNEDKIEACKEQQRKYAVKDWHCDVCDCTIHIGNKTNHLKSKKHLKHECNTCSSSTSDLSDTEAYDTWLCEEVLPSIRKFGQYNLKQELELAEATEKVKQIKLKFAEATEKVKEIEQELAEATDKIEDIEQELVEAIEKVEEIEQKKESAERVKNTPVFETPFHLIEYVSNSMNNISNVVNDLNVHIPETAAGKQSKLDF
jgi:septation ring formation regulator EzrA